MKPNQFRLLVLSLFVFAGPPVAQASLVLTDTSAQTKKIFCADAKVVREFICDYSAPTASLKCDSAECNKEKWFKGGTPVEEFLEYLGAISSAGGRTASKAGLQEIARDIALEESQTALNRQNIFAMENTKRIITELLAFYENLKAPTVVYEVTSSSEERFYQLYESENAMRSFYKRHTPASPKPPPRRPNIACQAAYERCEKIMCGGPSLWWWPGECEKYSMSDNRSPLYMCWTEYERCTNN